MSKLRKHLQSMQADYEAARYDGNLAADVLARQHQRHWSRWIVLAGTVAAAAAVMVVVVIRSNKPNQMVHIPQQTETAMVIEVAPAFSMTELTTEDGSASFAPIAAPDFSFSMPSITFVGDESSETSPTTTQESV